MVTVGRIVQYILSEYDATRRESGYRPGQE